MWGMRSAWGARTLKDKAEDAAESAERQRRKCANETTDERGEGSEQAVDEAEDGVDELSEDLAEGSEDVAKEGEITAEVLQESTERIDDELSNPSQI